MSPVVTLAEAVKRFWSRVSQPEDPTQCWLWQGVTDKDGYGYTRFQGRLLRAHRISYELANGPIADGLFVLHSCDTPGCVNPSHLRTGTHLENMEERGRKKRAAAGARNGRAKLTARHVRAIRQLYAMGSYTCRDLEEIFDVHSSIVSDIVQRKSWKDVA